MQKTLILLLTASVSAAAQVNNPRIEVNTLADLDLRYPLTNGAAKEVVYVRGYDSSNIFLGGPKVFYYDRTNALTTNAVIRAARNGVGRYVHPWDGDAAVFGVFPAGADVTANLQAALSHALPRRMPTRLYAGDFIVNSVTLGHQDLEGAWEATQNYGGTYGGGTFLIHPNGATNHMLRVIGVQSAERGMRIANLSLQGRGDYNAANKKTILTVPSRLSFTVATNDLPVNGGGAVNYPYYGHVFFYTSESKYVGYGIASNINYTTGLVDLHANFDHFATLSTTDNLSTNWSAVFSPSVTAYDDRGVAITAIDPSAAGYCGISFESSAPALKSVMNPVVQNVYIRGFHAGIRSSIALAPRTTKVWVNANKFAGIAACFGGYSYDWMMIETMAQGFYSDWNADTHPETLVLKNKAYRYQAYGIYGLDTTGSLGDLILDHNVNGGFLHHGADTHANWILVDGAVGHGLIFDSSRFGNRVHFNLPAVGIRSWSTYDVTNFNKPAGKISYALYAVGKNGATYPPVVQIGQLNTTRASDASNDYSALFHSDNSSARFQLRSLWITNGFTNFNSPATLVQYSTGFEADREAPPGGIVWNGVDDSWVVSAITNTALINTGDFTLWVRARMPSTSPTNSTRSLFGISGATNAASTGGAFYAGITAAGNLVTTLHAASSANGRSATLSGFVTEYPGKLVDIFWKRSSGTMSIVVNDKTKSYTESAFGGSPPANFGTGITNSYLLMGRGDKAYVDRIYRTTLWNRALSDAEIAAVSLFGVDASDRLGACLADLNVMPGTGNVTDKSIYNNTGIIVGTNLFRIE